MEEILICSRESANLYDLFEVKVSKSETIIGHLPRSISSVCSPLFFEERMNNIIDKEPRRFSRHGCLFFL